jgi:long-subunit acyl-CoA synthetase (AMP-forming)
VIAGVLLIGAAVVIGVALVPALRRARRARADARRGTLARGVRGAGARRDRRRQRPPRAREQVKRFAIVPGEWLPGGDELTPTSKLKRASIAAKYAAQWMRSTAEGRPVVHEPQARPR